MDIQRWGNAVQAAEPWHRKGESTFATAAKRCGPQGHDCRRSPTANGSTRQSLRRSIRAMKQATAKLLCQILSRTTTRTMVSSRLTKEAVANRVLVVSPPRNREVGQIGQHHEGRQDRAFARVVCHCGMQTTPTDNPTMLCPTGVMVFSLWIPAAAYSRNRLLKMPQPSSMIVIAGQWPSWQVPRRLPRLRVASDVRAETKMGSRQCRR